jgi:hypothetical protein
MKRHLLNATVLTLAGLSAATVTANGQDRQERAVSVLAEARKALGGAEKLAAIKTLQVVGNNRRRMGERDIEGELEILIETPDKLRRNEEMGIPGGPTIVRSEVLSGSEVWEDSSTHGGMGHGAVVMRMGGPGGDGDPERIKEMQLRMRRADLARFTLAWLLATDTAASYAGIAEAPDGKADVIEVKPADGPAMRLFIDQSTHLPLMMTWQGPQPRIMMRRGPGPGGARPDPDQIRREMEAQGPPPQVTFEMRFSEYKSVGGIKLPHLISRSAGGDTNEEWTISSYKVNSTFKAGTFEKK